jgi:hypothetical protein
MKGQDQASRRADDPATSAEPAIAPGKQTMMEVTAPRPRADLDASGIQGGARDGEQTSGPRGEGERAGDWIVDDGLMRAMGLGDYESDPAPLSLAGSPGGASGGSVAGAAVKGSVAAPGTKPAAKPEKKAPPVPVPSTDEPSQHADWQDVTAAAQKPGQEALDIEWINALPVHIRNSIDAKFSEKHREEAVHGKLSKASRSIDQEHKRRSNSSARRRRRESIRSIPGECARR